MILVNNPYIRQQAGEQCGRPNNVLSCYACNSYCLQNNYWESDAFVQRLLIAWISNQSWSSIRTTNTVNTKDTFLLRFQLHTVCNYINKHVWSIHRNYHCLSHDVVKMNNQIRMDCLDFYWYICVGYRHPFGHHRQHEYIFLPLSNLSVLIDGLLQKPSVDNEFACRAGRLTPFKWDMQYTINCKSEST